MSICCATKVVDRKMELKEKNQIYYSAVPFNLIINHVSEIFIQFCLFRFWLLSRKCKNLAELSLGNIFSLACRHFLLLYVF